MSSNAETLRPGVRWNATWVASLLMIVMITVIALAFWPAFEGSDATPPVKQPAHALAAPHDQVVVDGQVCGQCRP